MYKCEICGNTMPPKTPCKRVVLLKRQRDYDMRMHANPSMKNTEVTKSLKNKKHDPSIDPGGCGWEIERELKACPRCEAKHKENGIVSNSN